MNTTSNGPPRRGRRLIFVVVAMLATVACGRHESNLPTGAWSGDLQWPGQRAVWGATWHVAQSDSTRSLTVALETPSVSRTASVPLEVRGDSLRFAFPGPGRMTCRASEQSDGSWRGTCTPQSGSPEVGITMVPPNQSLPVGFARLALQTIDGDWQQTKAGRALVYTRPGTVAHAHLDRVTREARDAVTRAVEALRAPEWTGPVRFVYVERRETIEQVLGHAARGSADAGGNAVLLVTDDKGGTPVHHEMAHVVSLREWGAAHDPGGWIQEGVAEWAQGAHCGTVPHGRLDLYLHQRGDGLPLDTLTHAFWEHSDRITMPQVTTLVHYVVDAHGFDALRGLWEQGIGASKPVLGIDAETLEAEWRAWVNTHYAPATEEEWEASMGREKGCPFPKRKESAGEWTHTRWSRSFWVRPLFSCISPA